MPITCGACAERRGEGHRAKESLFSVSLSLSIHRTVSLVLVTSVEGEVSGASRGGGTGRLAGLCACLWNYEILFWACFRYYTSERSSLPFVLLVQNESIVLVLEISSSLLPEASWGLSRYSFSNGFPTGKSNPSSAFSFPHLLSTIHLFFSMNRNRA